MNLTLVLLAAGNSVRFEGNKLLYRYHGKPMYQHLIEQIDLLPEDIFMEKLVVTQYVEIKDALEAVGYRVIMNDHSEWGISSSIHLAVKGMKYQQSAICFAVCDQPHLKAATMESFIRGYEQSRKGIGCLCSMGELGNPAIFSSVYREALLQLQGDMGGRRIIRQHIDDLYLHEVADSRELFDIDEQHEAMS